MQASDTSLDRCRNKEDPLEIKGKERNDKKIKRREFQQGDKKCIARDNEPKNSW